MRPIHRLCEHGWYTAIQAWHRISGLIMRWLSCFGYIWNPNTFIAARLKLDRKPANKLKIHWILPVLLFAKQLRKRTLSTNFLTCGFCVANDFFRRFVTRNRGLWGMVVFDQTIDEFRWNERGLGEALQLWFNLSDVHGFGLSIRT